MPLMMTLITISALVQFLFANHLGFFRKLITPLVGGIAVMLIAVTVMPIVFSHFPAESGESMARPAIAFITLTAIVLLSFFGGRRLRLWAPLLGVIFGTLVAGGLGQWDLTQVKQAPWFGFPDLSWPGFDLAFGKEFWMLLPAFVIITIVGGIETYGDAIAIQQISHKKTLPIDYRTVQGALYADGLGNLLSGIFGTVPNTTYSTSISVVDMTGVGARKVGIFCGLFIMVLALFPKLIAAILSIPQPVVGSYMLVLIILLFTHGLKLVTEQGLTFERCIIIGMGFWIGTGFQQQAFFNALIPAWLAPVTNNGMTAGTVTTLILTGLLALNPGKKAVLKTRLSINSLPEANIFIRQFSRQNRWPDQVSNRLQLVVEEAFLSLIQIRKTSIPGTPPDPEAGTAKDRQPRDH
jgi:NCS2 family nucleobase:cation symporter-2/xanthine permease XanP